MALIPVFVSSTFRDFHGERGSLPSLVIPALDEAVAPFGARVELLDLRWGVDTTDLASEDQRQDQVLDVCLREINRCQPLFVGLLGDRFGWVPPADRVAAAVRRAKVPADPPKFSAGLSVTALEAWHGALEASGHAVFAMRDLYGDVPMEWRDVDPSATVWLRREVERATAQDPKRVQTFVYPARVVDGKVVAASLATFARQLVAVLTPLVVSRAQQLAARRIPPYEAAVMLLAESRRQVVVGRTALIDQIVEGLTGAAGARGMVMAGSSGVGKTSAWVAICDRLEASGTKVAKVLVGAGPGSSSSRAVITLLARQLRWEIPASTDSWDASSGDNPASSLTTDELLLWWNNRLATAPEGTVIAIDGADRLDAGAARDQVEPLQSIPASGGARFLVTTTLDEQVLTLKGRGLLPITVTALDPAQASEAALGWAKAEGARQLPRQVADVLGAKPRSGLWIRLAIDELNWLEQEHFMVAEAALATGTHADEAITAMLVEVVRHLPESDRDLAARSLDHAASVLGDPATTARFLGLLSITRSGLAPADLQALTDADPLTISRARWLLGGQVLQRDEAGRLAFDHQVIRDAARARSGAATNPRYLHALLARHLTRSGPPHPDGQSDLGWVPDRIDAEDAIFHAVKSGDGPTFARALAAGAASRSLDVAELIDALEQGMTSLDQHETEIVRDTIGTLTPDEHIPDGAVLLFSMMAASLRFRVSQEHWLLLVDKARELSTTRSHQYELRLPHSPVPQSIKLAELIAVVSFVQTLEFRDALTDAEADGLMTSALKEGGHWAEELRSASSPAIQRMAEAILLMGEGSPRPAESLSPDLQVVSALREASETPDPKRFAECVRFAGEWALRQSDDLTSSNPDQAELLNTVILIVLDKITDPTYGSGFRYPNSLSASDLKLMNDFDPTGKTTKAAERSRFRAEMWDLIRAWSAKAIDWANEAYLMSGCSNQDGVILARVANSFIRARLEGLVSMTDPLAVRNSDIREAFDVGARLTAALQRGGAARTYRALTQAHAGALWLLASEGLLETSNQSRKDPLNSGLSRRSWDLEGLTFALELSEKVAKWNAEGPQSAHVSERLLRSVGAIAASAETSMREMYTAGDFIAATQFSHIAVELLQLALDVGTPDPKDERSQAVRETLRDVRRTRALLMFRADNVPAALSDCVQAITLARELGVGRVPDESAHRGLLDALQLRAMILESDRKGRTRSREERDAWADVVAELELFHAMGWDAGDAQRLPETRRKTRRW